MKKPNIIIINPDEMRWDSMGHAGNEAACTPFIDRFVKDEAVSFDRAYCQNPVCVPSRCSFLTGLYPHVYGHQTMQHLLHAHETSLFKELKEAGYYVWMNARNDLVAFQVSGLAAEHASRIYYCDRKESVAPVDLSALTGGQAENGKDAGREKKNPYSHFEGPCEDVGWDGDWQNTRAAIEEILHPSEPEKPLCLFLGWLNPHPPYQVEKSYYETIDKGRIQMPVRYEETQNKSLMVQRLHELVGMDDCSPEQWRELRAVYLAQCAKVDEMFAAVCAALKEAGIYDDSAIFFLSDHGDFCGDYGLPEKAQNSFEDCLTRVPLLIKPPKGCAVDPGRTESLAELVDFYATAVDYAGIRPKRDHFGRSLRPVVENRGERVRDYVFAEGGRRA